MESLSLSQKQLALKQIQSRQLKLEREKIGLDSNRKTVLFPSKKVTYKGNGSLVAKVQVKLNNEQEELSEMLAKKVVTPTVDFSKKQAAFRREVIKKPNPLLGRSNSPKYAPPLKEVKEMTISPENRFRFVPPPLITLVADEHPLVDELVSRELTPRTKFRKLQAAKKKEIEKQLEADRLAGKGANEPIPLHSRLY